MTATYSQVPTQTPNAGGTRFVADGDDGVMVPTGNSHEVARDKAAR